MKQTLLPFPSRLLLLLSLLFMSSTAWAQSASLSHRVPLGSAAYYGLLSGGTIGAHDAAGANMAIQTQGKAGAGSTIGPLVAATAGVFAQGSGTVPQALADLQTAKAYCRQLNGQAGTLAGQLAGRTLTGGAYKIGGDAVLSQGSTLTISGDTATVVIINAMENLRLEAASQIILDGVLPGHVYWNVDGELWVAGGAAFMGNALVAGRVVVDGVQFGRYALLSSRDVTLTSLSATIGNNRLEAPQRPQGTCSGNGGSCTFTPPGSEMIVDGSFELAKCCPTGYGGLVEYSNSSSDACFWVAAVSQGSSDYFSTCNGTNTSPLTAIPNNSNTLLNGNASPVYALAQNSRATTGTGYGGIAAYAATAISGYREYVAQTTTKTLQAGRRYYGEFSAHIAPSSGYTVRQLGMVVAEYNSTGYNFPAYNGAPTVLPLTPVVTGNPNLPLAAGATRVTPGWQRVGQVFTASRTTNTALDIVVGNFQGDNTATATTTDHNGPSTIGQADIVNSAYYFIDNVTLSPLTEAGPNVALGANCAGGTTATSVTLGTEPMPNLVGATYLWTASPTDQTLTAPTSANPTVTPQRTTVYTLTVTIPGQAQPYTSQATITVNTSYGQNAGATYVSSDIGAFGTVTTLNANAPAYGGRIVFDGRYHVKGTVHLTGGTFELRPGTVFFVDGPSGLPASSGSDTNQTTLVVQNATLALTGATLQATCNGQQWGGVWLTGQGVINTDATASGVRSLVRDAQTAINSRADNAYYLNDTDFLHNDYGLVELASNKVAQRREGVRGCFFQDGLYGIVLAEGDYQPKVVFGGDYSEAEFSENTFSNLSRYGLYATAGHGHFLSNTFRNCGSAAMAAWNAPQAGQPEFTGNQITVPVISPGQTQVGDALLGPEGIFSADPTLLVTGNTIEGAPAPLKTVGGPLRIGIDFLYGSMDGTTPNQVSANTVRSLDEALIATTNDYDGATITVNKNFFVNNAADIVFYPWGNQNLGATVTATIRCNSFINDANSTVSDPIGIWLKDMAVITTGLEISPNGNEFPAYWKPTPTNPGRSLLNGNNNVNNTLDYKFFSNSFNENVQVIGFGTAIGDGSSPANACGGTAPGVNSRQYTASPISVSMLNVKLDSLRLGSLNAAQQNQLLRSIRRQPAQAMHLPVLEAMLIAPGTLGLSSQLALGLQVLEYYRTQRDLTNSARLRNWLRLHILAAGSELKAYLNLTQATDQMPNFLPGLLPLATANRTLLSQVATSGTTSARLACRLLRAYDPTCACVLPTNAPTGAQTVIRPATLLATQASTTQPLQAYPNPAGTTLHVPYGLLSGAQMAELRAYDALGRVVLRQALSSQQGEAEVSVQQWPAGLYQFMLVVDGQLQRQQRIVITH